MTRYICIGEGYNLMKQMKKVLTMLLIAVCMVSILGCTKNVGTSQDNASANLLEEEEEDVKDDYKIGFSVIDMENPYFITLESAAKEYLEEHGCTMITKDPGTDQYLQSKQIQEFVEEGIDAIILTPVSWEEITSSLKVLKDNGIKIINVDAQVKHMEYVDAYIGSDNYSAGYLCGMDLVEKCPEGGKIVILECPTQNSMNDRITGFEEALSKAAKGFEVVAREDTQGEFERALNTSMTILEENPDVTAIMCGNDQLAVGATTAANVLELKDVLIYGVDGSPDIKKELAKADTLIAGTAAQSPINLGKGAAEIALKILNGNEYEKETYEEVFMINAENVSLYGTDGWQ